MTGAAHAWFIGECQLLEICKEIEPDVKHKNRFWNGTLFLFLYWKWNLSPLWYDES